MRKELEAIEKIERYLKNQLSKEEKEAFENQLAEDPKLREEVDLQRELQQGIRRVVLKQQIKKVYKKYMLHKTLLKAGIIVGITVFTALVILYYNYKNHPHDRSNFIELNEQERNESVDAYQFIPAQNFTINTSKDTVIETDAGITFAIPANCFLSADGKQAEGTIELEIKEAMDASSIMQAGLTTMSDSNLLESAGMFYINAKQNETALNIDPSNSIYAEVPSLGEKRGDMQLFDGKVNEKGIVNWINPKPIENFLTPIDIFSLNFYPPGYLDSLRSWGYNEKDKKFTDSLYYSYARLLSDSQESMVMMPMLIDLSLKGARLTLEHYNLVVGEVIYVKGQQDMVYDQLIGTNRIEPGTKIPMGTKINLKVGNANSKLPNSTLNGNFTDFKIQTVQMEEGDSYSPEIKGINPAKIKAIWNKDFMNTLIATREFELRLQLIHKSCDNTLLDLYISNLGERLSHLDSMAAAQSHGETKRGFLSLASRNEGRVKMNSTLLKKLREYYNLKVKAYTQAAAKTEREYQEKQRSLEQKALNKKLRHDNEDAIRESENLKKEYDINLTEACKQLGIKKPKPFNGPTYGVTIVTTGWKNLDAYVMEATVNRTTLDYTSEDGKKAIIRYEPISITIKDYNRFDRLYVYLLPNKLNSFMRLSQDGDRFNEKLNELMSYKLFCLGYKGDNTYFFEIDKVEPKNYDPIELNPIDKNVLAKKLKALNNNDQSKDMIKELDYWKSEIEGAKRKKIEEDKFLLIAKVLKVILPCHEEKEASLYLEGEQLFKNHCQICHSANSRKIVGPGLGGITKRQSKTQIKKWILNSAQLIASGDPYAVKLYKEYNGLQMPMIALSNQEMEAIIYYLDMTTYGQSK